MRIAAKLVLVLLVGVLVLTCLRVYLALAQEEDEFEAEMSTEVNHLSEAMEMILRRLGHRWGGAIPLPGTTIAVPKDAAFDVNLIQVGASPGSPRAPLVPMEDIEAAFNSGKQWLCRHDDRGVLRVYLYLPVEVDGKSLGLLEATRPATELQRNKLNTVYRNLWVAGGTAILAILLVGVVGVRMVGRPIEQLVEKTRRVAKGDLSGPVHLKSRDELSELAESINDMCAQLAESQQRVKEETKARIKAMDQLRHSDRLRTVGRLAAGVAHELGTPLNVVSGRAGLIASGKLSDDDIAGSAATIKAEADRMTAIIRKLLDFARRNTPQRSPADLNCVARETVDLLSALARKRQVEIVVHTDDEPLVSSVDVGQIQQVLTNLIMNAVAAMPEGGRIDVKLNCVRATSPDDAEAGEADFVCLAVRDEGTGIAPEHVDQIFEPFFTTKDVGEGTGLGLSIAYGIVQEHGGWIDVASETGQGTCFYVHLPQEPPA